MANPESLNKRFVAREYPSKGRTREGITFLVAEDKHVLFTREYTRHRTLLERTEYPMAEIAWGGILTEAGTWVRRSFDFGDAPDPETREEVVLSIQKAVVR
jgi:hypothetical protein